MKKSFKKLMPITMAGIMIFGSIAPIFAVVKETETVTSNSTQQTEVTYNQESSFEVIVPKLVDLGSDKFTNYEVTVSGDISSDEVVKVVPDESFFMKDKSGTTNLKADVEATVTQDKTEWIFNEFETKANGNISAPNLTAGNWEGSFFFNISLDGIEQTPVTTYDATFANNTWEQIATACQNNEVPATWSVGDIKTMEVDGVEYEVVIIGKNHDTYADGSGTAPLTFQLVNVLDTTYRMNSTNTNAGGWDGSELYTTLNTTIFDTLEDDVKNNIKAVSKATNIGYVDSGETTATTTRTTSDKLFLLSPTEVFDYSSNTDVFKDEGTQYEYYATEANRIKTTTAGVASVWWLRSPYYDYNSNFSGVNTSGNNSYGHALTARGVAFGFCF